jgi:uncharacterized protein DUF3768
MPELDHKSRIKEIARLNDAFRTSLTGGQVVVTAGVAALDVQTRASVLKAVRTYTSFTPANDPYAEHDFGSLSVAGHKFFWKIDHYDPSLTRHSEDAANPSVTARVLTIMLAEEY